MDHGLSEGQPNMYFKSQFQGMYLALGVLVINKNDNDKRIENVVKICGLITLVMLV